jgi:hypothetical protein
MAHSRYTVIDAYTLEELCRRYRRSNSKERIRFLKLFARTDHGIPPDIATMAVTDDSSEVREWIALNGSGLGDDLRERIRQDSEPMVRACFRENPEFVSQFRKDAWIQAFGEATELERLALMRNLNIHGELVEAVFDPEDTSLGLGLGSRKQLVLAFLGNVLAVAKNRAEMKRDSFADTFDVIDSWSLHDTQTHYTTLWKKMSRWPRDMSSIKSDVYRTIRAPDDTMAEVYAGSEEVHLRKAILEVCEPDDLKTLLVAMKDSNDDCRWTAFSKFDPDITARNLLTNVWMDALLSKGERAKEFGGFEGAGDGAGQAVPSLLEHWLKGDDKAALRGLADNRRLSIEYLRRVEMRLGELGDYFGEALARNTIKGLEKTDKGLEKTYEGESNDLKALLTEKASALEDRLIEIAKRATRFEKRLNWAIILSIFIVFLMLFVRLR